MGNLKIILVGIALAALFWPLDSAVDSFFFGESTFIQQLFNPEPLDIYKRSVAAVLLLILSVYAQRNVNDRKRAEETLRVNEERYRMLVESMNDGLGIQDENGLITFVNDALCEMFGYSQDELVGRPVADLIAPDHRDSYNENMARRRIGENASYETVFRRKDGQKVHTVVSPQRIEDAEGRFLGSFAVITDITQRKRAEQAIRQSEEKHRAIYNASPDFIYVTDVEGNYLDANPSLLKRLGLSLEQLRQMSVADFFAGDSLERLGQVLADLKAGRQVRGYEEQVKTPRGETFTCEINAVPLEEDGVVRRVLNVARDITERKRVEDFLRLQSEILENMAEGVLLARTGDGVIIYTNPTFERMFRYPPGGLIDKHVSILNASAEKDPQETAALIMESLRKNGKWSGEVHNIRADGTTFWTRASVSALEHREYGDVWVTAQEDITERKRAEEALSESEEKYRTLFHAAGDAILLTKITDQDLFFIDCNSRAATMFGATREEIMGKMPLDFSPPLQPDGSPSKQKASEMLRAAIEGGSLSFDWRHCRQDGTPFDTEVTLNRVVLGGEICIQGIIRDRTEEKRIEEAFSEISFREQERIRRDLHDSVGQDLTGLSGMARSLTKKLRNHSLPEAEAAEDIVRGIQQTLDDVQSAIKGLGPVEMDPLGLMVALEQLVNTTQDQHDMDIRFVCKGQVTIENNNSATHLYRIAQEAITNAVKYSKAEHTTVSLIGKNGRLSLEIRDDGVGMGEDVKHSGGMGLRIMRYRAKTLGAELRIDSPDGDGTCITCTCTRRDLPSAVR